MPEQQHSDDEELTTEDLEDVLGATASANTTVTSAVNQMAGRISSPRPESSIQSAHRELVEAYQDVTWAIDRAEVVLDSVDYGRPTPRQIKREHGDRIAETYDRPVREVALQLLEWNRRKWLHGKPETNGADEVERHGLTGSQRKWLNELQAAATDFDVNYGAIETTIATLRGEAEELREREDVDSHLEHVAEQLEHRADRLEEAIGGVADAE